MFPPLTPGSRSCRVIACALLVLVLTLRPQGFPLARASVIQPSWAWPLQHIGVTRDYVAPATEYGAGHRGVDFRATTGDPVLSIGDGVVEFAGPVATIPTLVIVHIGGWRSSYQPVSAVLAAGQSVSAGQRIGTLAAPTEHCSCLHLGLRFQGEYLSPLAVLGHIPRAVLLPW